VPVRATKLDIFYRINITLPMFVPIGNMKALLASNHKEWFLDATSKREEFTGTIHLLRDNDNYTRNLFGHKMNSTSRDHCQANTNQTIYELLPVIFISVNKSVKTRVKKSVNRNAWKSLKKNVIIGGRSSKRKEFYGKRKNTRKKKQYAVIFEYPSSIQLAKIFLTIGADGSISSFTEKKNKIVNRLYRWFLDFLNFRTYQ
jgi:hypothetical protein